MDLSNIQIPRFFSYDFMARVVPGAFTTIAIIFVSNSNLALVSDAIFGSPDPLSKSPSLTVLFIVLCGFITGILISSLSTVLESLMEHVTPKNFNIIHHIAQNNADDIPESVRTFVRIRVRGNDNPQAALKTLYSWYDEVRAHSAYSADGLTRTRAEYKMFGSLAIGMTLTLLWHIFKDGLTIPSPDKGIIIILSIIILVLVRGFVRAAHEFQYSVLGHYI